MTVVSKWDKFKLLLWKNWILQWHSPKQILIELLTPSAFILILVILRLLLHRDRREALSFTPLRIEDPYYFKNEIYEQLVHEIPKFEILYSPINDILEKIVSDAAKELELDYKGYKNANNLEDELILRNSLAGIQFEDSLANIKIYPPKLSFGIRFPSELRTVPTEQIMTWSTTSFFEGLHTAKPRNVRHPDGGLPPGYFREGFLAIQHTISMVYIKLASKEKDKLPQIFLQRFPYPAYERDQVLDGVANYMAFILLLGFIFPCTSLTKQITYEKEHQLKDVMNILGVPNWIHWTAWFVQALVTFSIASGFAVFFLKLKLYKTPPVLPYSNWTILLFLLVVYSIALISFCFLLAAIFSKANTAAALTVIILFINIIPLFGIISNFSIITFEKKLAWCLLCNTAIGMAVIVISSYEYAGEGLQWHNIFNAPTVDDRFSIAFIILMLLVSSLLCVILCLYLEQVLSGEFGTTKRWNYPFTKQYWWPQNTKVRNDMNESEDTDIELQRYSQTFEPEPGSSKPIGIQLKNLKKKFGQETVVKGITMNLYEGEITVLLGHNGSGKTTIIHMLAGICPPTQGTAIINGNDIRTNITAAQACLGLCSQDNVLFENMNVRDHIYFFSRLRGLTDDILKKEVDKYLNQVELESKAKVPSKNLSGGMKRKLCICCALCGNSKVVLFDEPSSSLDPTARRKLWDLLQEEKKGKTILLTTHFMDEANVLGDRIAIIMEGELKCYGTSFFLKKTYGTGYHLICEKGEQCRAADVTILLQTYIPNIQPERDVGNELSYQLPNDYLAVFEKMLKSLEDNSQKLYINGYGISIASMEEVFMKVGVEESINQPKRNLDMNNSTMADERSYHDKRYTSDLLYQLHAMFLKKFFYTRHNILLFAFQNIMPTVVIIFSITSIVVVGFSWTLPAMTISLTQYRRSMSILEIADDIKSDSLEAKIVDQYKSIVTSFGPQHTLETLKSMDMEDYIRNMEPKMRLDFSLHCFAAATIAQGKITAWLNNQPLHTAPLTINLVHNALAKVLISPIAEIVVTNAPLPYTTHTIIGRITKYGGSDKHLGLDIGFCMCFISAMYIILVIKERESRYKLLQFIGGINVLNFWISYLLWDMLTFIFTIMVILTTLAFFEQRGYSDFEDLGRAFILFFVFGITALPLTYLLAFLCKSSSSGYSRIFVLNIFAGCALYLLTIVLLNNKKPTAEYLQWFFRVVPHFSFTMGLHKLYENKATRSICSRGLFGLLTEEKRCAYNHHCCTVPYFDWKYPGILPEISTMVILLVIVLFLLLIIEYDLFKKLTHILFRKVTLTNSLLENQLDEDVAYEKNYILTMSLEDLAKEHLVLNQVTKFYGNFLAVNAVSLRVGKSECFGLLGVNGAGKTTTFKMITGDERISSGNIYVNGMNVQTDINKIYKMTGYCPQFDGVLDDFTGRETLEIFCLLRGIHIHVVDDVVEEMALIFGFLKHIDTQIKNFSGGSKRKLSTAISVLGNPSIIYLDEPTSGMDPISKRQIWKALCQLRDSGTSIVLTSHSMEECEALCTRLAIMVNGEFKCLGSTQHLKNRFSKGLVLKIKIKHGVNNFSESDTKLLAQKVAILKQFVGQYFPTAQLQEEYHLILTYYIVLDTIKWSEIFNLMENNREQLNIEDYIVSQTTLEDIFIEFAKHQDDDLRLVTKKKKTWCFS